MTIHLDERMNAEYQANDGYESLGFMEAVSVTDFPIRDHKVVLKLRRRRWKNKHTGESFVEKISVSEKGTRYSKEFAAFLKLLLSGKTQNRIKSLSELLYNHGFGLFYDKSKPPN